MHLTTEDDTNTTHLLERAGGSPQFYTGEWNDDFHHAAHVIATHEADGYYDDYTDDPVAKLARALPKASSTRASPRRFATAQARRAERRSCRRTAFIDCLQNHDQVGNRAFGERLASLAAPEVVDALTAVLLLSPGIPLLFMGEEWGETRPFLFFTDFHGELARQVREGRRNEFRRWEASAIRTASASPIPMR